MSSGHSTLRYRFHRGKYRVALHRNRSSSGSVHQLTQQTLAEHFKKRKTAAVNESNGQNLECKKPINCIKKKRHPSTSCCHKSTMYRIYQTYFERWWEANQQQTSHDSAFSDNLLPLTKNYKYAGFPWKHSASVSCLPKTEIRQISIYIWCVFFFFFLTKWQQTWRGIVD